MWVPRLIDVASTTAIFLLLAHLLGSTEAADATAPKHDTAARQRPRAARNAERRLEAAETTTKTIADAMAELIVAATSSSTIVPSATESPTTTTSSSTMHEKIMAVTMLDFVPGALNVSSNGLLLSQGLTSRIIAVTGEVVLYDFAENGGSINSTQPFHVKPDGGAVFRDLRDDNDGGWIYVSNSEKRSTGKGGVGAITFDKFGAVVDYRMVLSGSTKSNCGGGPTPWGSWISCEETDEGRNWQVDPTGQREPGIITLGNDGGRFESFAYDMHDDVVGAQFFVTEDEDDGALQRFRPYEDANWIDPWNVLYGNGTTDFLLLDPDEGTFSFTHDRDAAKENAENYYPHTEGIDAVGGYLYFISKELKYMYILNLRDGSYTNHSTVRGAFDGQPDAVARILNSNDELLYFTEEGSTRPGIHARSRNGLYFTILEGLEDEDDETTGLAFSPDGQHLYFAMQDAGLIFDVTRTDGLPFHGKTLNIKYHERRSDRI